MNGDLGASVVISTLDRAPVLRRLLVSLRHLEGYPFEVVVVNGPSTDATEEMLAAFDGPVKLVHCPVANVSLSRNLGIAAAAGDVVVFIDDDALPGDPGWLSRLVSVFAQDGRGRVGAAGGATRHLDTRFYQFKRGLVSDYGEQVFRREDNPHVVPDGRRWFSRVVGNNMAFRRSALQAIAGFDERLAYYQDEDDVCIRLTLAGYEIVMLDDHEVRHYPAPSPSDTVAGRDLRVIARSDAYFAMKHGNDPLPKRLWHTLSLAPQKHYVTELHAWRKHDRLTGGQWAGLMRSCLRGACEGLAWGLLAKPLNRLPTGEPAAFLPFDRSRPPEALSICLLCRHLPPDPACDETGRHMFDLARGLHELGHAVVVVADSPQVERWLGLEFTVRGVTAEDGAPRGSLFPFRPSLDDTCRYALGVGHLLQRLEAGGTRFDVVVTPGNDPGGLILPMLDRWPYAVLATEAPDENEPVQVGHVDGSRREVRTLAHWLMRQGAGVPGSADRRRDGSGNVPRPDVDGLSRVVSAVPGVFCDGIKHLVPRGGERRFLFMGRFDHRDGFDQLLAVLPRLLAKHGEWTIDLVADGPPPAGVGFSPEAEFVARYAGQPWLPRVHFVRSVAEGDFSRLFRGCDVFVRPSLCEPLGTTILQAMACGRPVVGCPVGVVPGIVSHGVDGLLVSPGDEWALAEALDRLMSDADLRTGLGQAARAKVLASFTHLDMARPWAGILRTTIAEDRGGVTVGD